MGFADGAVELRWCSPLEGGGLPLTSFKVGVSGNGDGSGQRASTIVREVTVSFTDAIAGRVPLSDGADDPCPCDKMLQNGRSPALPSRLGEFVCCTTVVTDLLPSAQYSFMLAASNILGTGRWSPPTGTIDTTEAGLAAPV